MKFLLTVAILVIAASQGVLACTFTATRCSGSSTPVVFTTPGACRTNCTDDSTSGFFLIDSNSTNTTYYSVDNGACDAPVGMTLLRFNKSTDTLPCTCVARTSGVGRVCTRNEVPCVLRFTPAGLNSTVSADTYSAIWTNTLLSASNNLLIGSLPLDGDIITTINFDKLELPSFSSGSWALASLLSTNASFSLDYNALNTLVYNADKTAVAGGLWRQGDSYYSFETNGVINVSVSTRSRVDGSVVLAKKGTNVMATTTIGGTSAVMTSKISGMNRLAFQFSNGGANQSFAGKFNLALVSMTITNYKLAALFNKVIRFAATKNYICGYIASNITYPAYKLVMTFNFPIEYYTGVLGGIAATGPRIAADLSALTGLPASRFNVSAAYASTTIDVVVLPANATNVANQEVNVDVSPMDAVNMVMNALQQGQVVLPMFFNNTATVTFASVVSCPDGTYRDTCADLTVSGRPAVIALVVLTVFVALVIFGYWVGARYMGMKKRHEENLRMMQNGLNPIYDERVL